MSIRTLLKKKKTVVVVALLCAATLYAGIALAGRKSGLAVLCSNGVMCAGDLGATRNSTNPNQDIGCMIVAGCNFGMCNKVTCSGTDAYGNRAICSGTTPELKQAATAISGDSYINFTCQGGILTSLMVDNSSTYQLKAH